MTFPALSSEVSLKALKFLLKGFEQKEIHVQKQTLRQVALLESKEAIPRLAQIALHESYDEGVRREAVKAILALDSNRYRALIQVLQGEKLNTEKMNQTFQVLGLIPGSIAK